MCMKFYEQLGPYIVHEGVIIVRPTDGLVEVEVAIRWFGTAFLQLLVNGSWGREPMSCGCGSGYCPLQARLRLIRYCVVLGHGHGHGHGGRRCLAVALSEFHSASLHTDGQTAS